MRALNRKSHSGHFQLTSLRALAVAVFKTASSLTSWSHHARTGNFESLRRFLVGFVPGGRELDGFDVWAARRGFV